MNLSNLSQSYYESGRLKKPFFTSLGYYLRLMVVFFSHCFKAARGKYSGEDWASASLGVVKALEAVGVHFSIHGLNHINDLKGPAVFIANHMSTLETFVLPCLIQPRKDVTFVVKKSLVSYPFFKHILLSRDPIVVGRKNPREDLAEVLKSGAEKLKSGRSIIVFPQSTRSAGIDPKLFNSIGIKLAQRARVPVIPIALKTDAWGTGPLIKEFGAINNKMPVNILFGPPLAIEGRGKDEHEKVFNFIESKLLQWQDLQPQLIEKA